MCPAMPVAEYCVLPSNYVPRKIDPASGIDPVEYLTMLGMNIFNLYSNKLPFFLVQISLIPT